MKKLLTVTLLFLVSLAIVACGSADENGDSTRLFDSQEELLGFSVISSLTTLSSFSQSTSTVSANEGTFLAVNNEEDVFNVLSDIEELEEYLALARTLLGHEQGFSVNVEASANEDYEYQMTISMLDLNADVVEYEFFYNETIISEDEDEIESIIEGIITIDGVEYTVYGEREIEEGEESLELTASIDDDNYVTFKFEIEIDETEFESEFEYELFIDNQLYRRTEITFEQDEDELEMSLKFIEGDYESEYDIEIEFDGNETKFEIEFKIVIDGETVEEGEIEIEITYNEATDTYTIIYKIEVKNHGTVIVERETDEEDDDNDDNDDVDDEEDNNETNNSNLI